MENINNDKELHRKFVILGNNRRKLTNELLALLPEVYEKEIYKKYSATIVEYAGKFGGLSKGVVMKRLRLEKHLKDKPILREAIRTEGVHKVALIAKLATAETENIWVDKLKNMSKSSLFELAKEVREKVKDRKCRDVCAGAGADAGAGAGVGIVATTAGLDFGFCKAVPQKVKIELEGELLFMFLKLKKKYGNNLNNNEVIKKILETATNVSETKPHKANAIKQEAKTHQSGATVSPEVKLQASIVTQSSHQKVQIFPGTIFTMFEVGTMENENPTKYESKHEVPEKITKDTSARKISTKTSHYISVKIKKPVLSSTNGKCSYPGCEKPAEIIHHPERFAKSQNHNNIKPLCKIHHEFMHNGLVKNEQSSADGWQLELDGKLDEIDIMYRKYRRVWAES